ncbi:FtsH protease activity modulator HflK [Legionella taurinensis]|uniref:Protein HflK n=1 Tax=Legionella taurinensis TaxID=70611 RepID=A0AB38N3J2_9GAMM|nr:FtsH protease activity modulator HflK [Legionella taurinensis]MDX1837702.1 FtsH protease activity modulator HflK [Legionella taurinensis]PUT39985.1 FtsH protease activity modulator HflK [Legionella taurinensis]PUT43751.1 FtsH protease activity modulator HflK [Legionella taurinensis]PUT46116.1 FtsH protease activity modulator HflK [Legionella taurinensis]PUT47906.1 FtsH protease activity modulator HflK [Legionella taurinensis]
MGWNEPEKGKDPWGGKDQPPDLDEALKRFQERLKKALFGGSGQEGGGAAPKQGNGGLLAGMAALILFILWALSGIFIVDPAEQAVILRFGKYVETVGPGPHWIPRIISTKIVHNVERISHYSYSAQMLTKDENLVSVSLVVQYRIGDLEDYLFNVADPQESLQQTTSSALRQVVGKTTLNQIITEGREAWGTDVQDVLVKTLKKYNTGIVIVNVSPQPARAPESVQDAFDDAIKAREDEKRFQGQALAYQARVVPIAEGNAKRILAEAKADAEQAVLRAKGEVAEFLALLPQYTQAPTVTSERMYLETMQRVLSRSTKVIVDSKAGNLLYLPLDKLGTSMVPQPIPAKGKSMAANAGDNEEDSLVAGRQTKRQLYRQGRNE